MDENKLREQLAYDETFSCVQCGYCLPSCPTYVTFGNESHSPRGRINLVKLAAEGKLPLNDLIEPIDLCLGCRACEIVCPTNVDYGKILTSAVTVLNEFRKPKQKPTEKLLRKFVLRKSLNNKALLNVLGKSLYVYQKIKLDRGLRKINMTKLLPKSLERLEAVTPPVSLPEKRRSQGSKKTDEKPNNLRIGYFPGCIMDTFFARINDLSIKLLEAQGCEVITIKEQGCCGALQHHAGEQTEAIERAKQNIEAYEQYDFDYIVNAIGGCGAQLVEYPLLFSKDDPWYERAKNFGKKSKDIAVILSKLDIDYKREINKLVTYQPSCHLSNVQKVVDEPLTLLKNIPGIRYSPLEESEMCCGSAGIYNVIHHNESMEILDGKMKHVKRLTPEIIVTTNPGCHLQMLIGVEREGLADEIKVVHLVELLAEACL